jgi:hypothetical protein
MFRFTNGDIYIGNWKDNRADGKGVLLEKLGG